MSDESSVAVDLKFVIFLTRSLCGWLINHHAAFAVPYWKVFLFGGNSGDLDQNRPQGYHRNDIQVMECIESSENEEYPALKWDHPITLGDIPSPRSDTEMFYSESSGKLFLFGGWSNTWHNEVYTCEISSGVGPPYNIFSMKSTEWNTSQGPLTGGSKMILNGKGFTYTSGRGTIRFACAKGFLEVNGDVLNDNQISLETPNFEKYGPVTAEVRVKIGALSLTNNCINFEYFSVTDCTKTVAFGPGLLENIAPRNTTMFVIQAKDKSATDRICGMDEFIVKIYHQIKDSDDKCSQNHQCVPHTLDDNGDGTYIVEYEPCKIGYYSVRMEFSWTCKGRKGPICGSPFIARAVDGTDPTSNTMKGKALQEHILQDIELVKTFVANTSKGLLKGVSKDEINALIAVKEHIRRVAKNSKVYDEIISSKRAALLYMKRKGIKFPHAEKVIKSLESTATGWSHVKAAVPVANGRISAVESFWAEKTKFKIEVYSKDLQEKQEVFRRLQFWSSSNKDGGRLSKEEIDDSFSEAQKTLNTELRLLEENRYLCDIFEMSDSILNSQAIVEQMEVDIKEMRHLWGVSQGLDNYMISIKSLEWAKISIESLEEGGKAQQKYVKSTHECTRWSEAFSALEKKCKDLLATIPLISLLRSKALRPRHWRSLIEITGTTNFIPSTEQKNMPLGMFYHSTYIR